MKDSSFDVVVVGAGPAGATAATLIARMGRSVMLVDRETFPQEPAGGGWLSARAIPLLKQMGVGIKSLTRCPIAKVTFHNADFTKSAAASFDAPPGYLIDRAELANALVKTAVRRRVTVAQGCTVVDIRLKEPGAILDLLGGKELEGRLLLLASGADSPLPERVGVAPGPADTSLWTAQVGAPLERGSRKVKPSVGVVLGLDRAGSFAVCCVSKTLASITINLAGEREEAATQLTSVCRLAFENKLVPIDLTPLAPAAKPVASPAGAALDMDSHVAKHTLLIGEAGGFVAAASNEGIYPAMWSAQIAAEVAVSSLTEVHSQDELMKFDSVWRIQMADYIRSPQTDTQFLLPLVFSNQPMADRFAAAFFCGENI